MGDDSPPRSITTSAGSWLGASVGTEIGSLAVLPVGFLLSIWMRSQVVFYLTLLGWAVFAGTGGYWIRRHRYRFNLEQQMLERQTLWFFRSARLQRIAFNRITSFEVADTKNGPRLLMRLDPGEKCVIKTGSRRRLEPLRRALSAIIPHPDLFPEHPEMEPDDAALNNSAPIAEPVIPPTVMEQSVVEEQNDAGLNTAASVPVNVMEAAVIEAPSSAVQSAAVQPAEPPSAPTVFMHSDLPSSAMEQLKVGIIGGSGLGQLLGEHAASSRRHEIHTPFGAPSDAIIETEWAGVPVFLLARHGPGHLLNPTQVPYQANIFALKQLGCTHIIASGAVGSLREEMNPRDLAIPDQIIDKTTRRPTTFYDKAAVHVEFSEPFCPMLRQILIGAGTASSDSAANHATHDRGCYVVMEGPAFSTRAESLMHRLWGGDLIGMTAMPEAKLAREAEISYAMVALVTDYDCWKQKAPVAPGQTEPKAAAPVDPSALLKEIIGNLEAASANAMALIRRAIKLIAARQEELMKAPARNALQLAIWSDKAKIPPDEIARLKVLWGRHFQKLTVDGEMKNAEVRMQNAE
jgi:5'-methylthioadenosine phosphorylase